MNDTQAEVVRLVAEMADKPLIRVVAGELATVATNAEAALLKAGLPIYQRGPALVRPVVQTVDAAHGRQTQVAQFATVETTHLRDLLSRVARWEKFDRRKNDWRSVDPPAEVAATVVARFGEWKFPTAVGVVTTPTLRPDGTVLVEPGYDPMTRLVLIAPPALPAIPADPTRDDALAALTLLDSLLEEFPLVDRPSRSVAQSALITPIVRGAFPVAPLHVARALST